MGSTKKHDGKEWKKFGSTNAIDIKITDFSGNFDSDNVEGALREASSKISDINSSVEGQKEAIKKQADDINKQKAIVNAQTEALQQYATRIQDNMKKIAKHEDDIAYLMENGGGGGGGNIAPTITSKFEDGTIVEKNTDVIIPIFFSSPNLGDGTAYIVINGIEVNSISVKAGNNNVNIGKLTDLHNEVSIYVKDRIGMLSNQLSWNIICGGIDLTIDFDSTADYGVTDTIAMQFNVTSASSEPIIMHLTIDYDEYEVPCSQGFNEYTFTGLGVGIHKVSLYLTSGPYRTTPEVFNIVVVNAEALYVSSTFAGGTFEYGVPIAIEYRISKLGTETFNVRLELDGELNKTLALTVGTYYWTLNETPVGSHTYTIIVESAYGERMEVSGTFEVVEGEYTPLKIIEAGLTYRLSAKGRTNNDSDRNLPKDNSGNGVKTELHNFNYFSNGWIDGALVCDGSAYVEIDAFPWSENAIYGSTIEIQYKGLDIGIFGARIFDYTDVETPYKGVYIDLEETTMKSLANTGKINLDADTWITVSFVIDRSKKFGKIFIDGICSRAFSLSDTGSGTTAIREDFSHMQKIFLNSRKGEDKFGACEIKDVRVYNRVLSDDEIVQNYIAQVEDLTEQKKLYDLNYNNTTLPTIKMYGDTSNMTLETPVTMRIKYTSPNEDKYGQSFDLPYCQVNWQGTSSLQYVLKNFTARLKDENMADYYYTPYPNGVPETTFCFKADYMESTHSRNAGLAKFVNECLYDEKNPAQLENANIRNTVNGFPTLLYINDELQGVYNFNLDRYSTYSYGYTKDTTLVYEVSANSDTTAGAFYKWTEATGKSKIDYYKSDFECVYPPTRAAGNDDMAELIRLVEWVNDSSDEDFKDNMSRYFNIQYLLRYFLYVYVVGAVDSLGKNMKLTTWDGLIWYPQVYDADTTIGLDNTGFLKFDMDIEMGDEGVFNTTGSKLWQRVQLLFKAELEQQYALMRQKYFTVENMMKYILEEQIEQIPAVYYNKDMQTKYLNYGSSYLYALHGSSEHHIRKWLRERLIYCDTLFNYNVSTSDYITLRSSKLGYVYLDIQTYIPMYVRVKWRDEANNTGVQVKRVARGETVRFEYNMPTATDQEIIVYAGYYLKSLGDVSNLQPTSMLIANASRLTEITCHSPNLINTDLSECTKLQKIDLSDSTALGTGIGAQPILNIQNCKYLRYCNCHNTQLTAIYTMQQGGNLEELYFPDTAQIVQVTNQTYLRVLGIPYGYANEFKMTNKYLGKQWAFGYYAGTSPTNLNDPTALKDCTTSSFAVSYDPIPVTPGQTYKIDVLQNKGYVDIYEFNSDGKRVNTMISVGLVSYGQRSYNYTPLSDTVAQVAITVRGSWTYGNESGFRFAKLDEFDTFKYCRNLANVQISNCRAIEHIQYPYAADEAINFDALRYVQNLTLINSLDGLTKMTFSGFNKLRNVTLSSLMKLEELGFDDMLVVGDVSTIQNVTISDCPLVETISFNVSSDNHKVEFAQNGVIDISGLQSCKTIETNYSIKGLNKIILPISIKNVYLSSDFGDGDNELSNLWSSTAVLDHRTDGFMGIDFKDLDLENFRMEGCDNLTHAINFYLTPVNELPNLAAFEYLHGWVNFDRYVGDVRYMFKGINFTFDNFSVIFNTTKEQTDITGLFQNAIITKAQFDNVIDKFPNAEIFDYFLENSTIEEDYSFPNTAKSVVGAFRNCINMTKYHENWNTDYNSDIVSTECYTGCYNIDLAEIPVDWGGYGLYSNVTTKYEVTIPSDNYTLTISASSGAIWNASEGGAIDWGDGEVIDIEYFSASDTTAVSHTYETAGVYTIRAKFNLANMANVIQSFTATLTKVLQEPIERTVYLAAYANCTKLTSVNLPNLRPTEVQTMFSGTTSLKEVIGGETWDMSRVPSINYMFYNSGLTDYSFLENWNLINCGGMSNAFRGIKATSLDLSGWTTSSNGITALQSAFNGTNLITLDISNFKFTANTTVTNVLTSSPIKTITMNNVRWVDPAKVNAILVSASNLTTVVMDEIHPDMVNFDGIFANCNKITHDIQLPERTVSAIGAFQNCVGMTHVHSNWETYYPASEFEIPETGWWITGTYINNATGEALANTGFWCTPFIELNSTITLTSDYTGHEYIRISGYDANKNFIAAYDVTNEWWIPSSGTAYNIPTDTLRITPRSDIKYIRFSAGGAYCPVCTISMGIPSVDCYAGCVNIKNIDDEEVNNGLDLIPMGWGGYEFLDGETAEIKIDTTGFANTALDIFQRANIRLVDWGDGTVESYVTTLPPTSHTYTSEGIFTIKARRYQESQALFECGSNNLSPKEGLIQTLIEVVRVDNPTTTAKTRTFLSCTKLKKATIDYKHHTGTATCSFFQYFYGCTALEEITLRNFPPTSNLQSFCHACSSLKTIDTDDILASYTANNVSLQSAFYGCTSLADFSFLKKWSLNKVSTLFETFRGCTEVEYLDLSNTNMPVTAFRSMLYGCTKLKEVNTDGWLDPLSNPIISAYNCESINVNCPALTNDVTIYVGTKRRLSSYSNGGCTSLPEITDLSEMDTSQISSIGLDASKTGLIGVHSEVGFGVSMRNMTKFTTLRNCHMVMSQYGYFYYGGGGSVLDWTFETYPGSTNYMYESWPNNAGTVADLNFNMKFTDTRWTVGALVSFLECLYDYAAEGRVSEKVIKFGANLDKLTDEQIAIATNKGWTLS